MGIRSIWQSTQKSAARLNQKLQEFPEGNLVLLCNHQEGHNKIQDKYKSEKFVVVAKHPEPNVYHIKPVNGNGPSRQSINANFRISVKPKMMEDLPVLKIIMIRCKFPPLTLNQ